VLGLLELTAEDQGSVGEPVVDLCIELLDCRLRTRGEGRDGGPEPLMLAVMARQRWLR